MIEAAFEMLCYSIEYFKIIFAFFILLGAEYISIKRMISVSAASCSLVLLVSVFVPVSELAFADTAVLMISVLLILKQKKDIIVSFVIYMYICILDMTINGFLMYFIHVSVEDLRADRFLYILFNLPTLAIITAVILINHLTHKDIPYSAIRGNLLFLLVGGIAIAIYITSLQLFAFSDMSKKYVKLAAVSVSICSIILMFVFFRLIRISAAKEKLKAENNAINLMLEMQKKHYLALRDKEDETKAFRHDFRNHIFSLSSLYKNRKYDEFEKYLSELSEKYTELSTGVKTGNSLIDAMLNELIGEYSDVIFKKKGYIPEELSISAFDVCTIFFNIFKNAFEAADATAEKKVELYMGVKNTNLLIRLKNTASSAPLLKNNCYVSTKKANGHGYGLRNVINHIEKLNGEFEIEYSEDTHFVTVNVLLLKAIPDE